MQIVADAIQHHGAGVVAGPHVGDAEQHLVLIGRLVETVTGSEPALVVVVVIVIDEPVVLGRCRGDAVGIPGGGGG